MFAQLGPVISGLLRIKVGTASRITGSSIDKKQGIERRDLLHAGSALRSQVLLIWGRLQNLDPLHVCILGDVAIPSLMIGWVWIPLLWSGDASVLGKGSQKKVNFSGLSNFQFLGALHLCT